MVSLIFLIDIIFLSLFFEWKSKVLIRIKYVFFIGFENELKIGIKIDFMGGIEVVVK